jgi:hypothetical protein
MALRRGFKTKSNSSFLICPSLFFSVTRLAFGCTFIALRYVLDSARVKRMMSFALPEYRDVIVVHDMDIELVVVAGIAPPGVFRHDGPQHLLFIGLDEYSVVHDT